MTQTKKTSMSRTRKAALGVCAVSTIGLMSIQPAFADCTRHFVNQTDKTWEINVIDNKKQSDWVTVGPRQTVAYTYTTSLLNGAPLHGTWSQDIHIVGPSPENYDESFILQGQADGDCVYIDHPRMGNTGSATVNEPANGDLIFWRAD